MLAERAVELLVNEAGAATRDVDDFPNQVSVDLLLKVLKVDIHIAHAVRKLAGVVVAEVFG